MAVERVLTGIKGLDEMLNGGIPKNSNVLVAGSPGSAKTTLCLQYIVHGAMEAKENGVYISLEEDPDRLLKNVENSFSWPVQQLIRDKKISMVRAELYNFEKLKILIEDQVERYNATRLVIDPQTVLGLYFEKPLDVRKSMLNLDKMLKKLNCTTLMTAEIPDGTNALSSFGVEEFTADGIITMYYIKTGNAFTRAITVRKMRSTAHDTGIHPIEITKDGLIVYSTEQVFQDVGHQGF